MLTNSPSYYAYTDKINICPNTTPIRLYIIYILKKKKQETPKKIKMYYHLICCFILYQLSKHYVGFNTSVKEL